MLMLFILSSKRTVGNAVPGVPTAEGGSSVYVVGFAHRNAGDGVPYGEWGV
jgi:hypothetical protein